MTATNGRLESATVVPAGGWTLTVNDGLSYAATLTAATVYSGPTAVVTALVAALNAAAIVAGSARTWTGSIASGESGTGYVTLTISAGANTTGTWTTTTLRDYLGWAANLSGAITYTSPSGCLGMWLPDCPISQPFPLADTGNVESDATVIMSPAGTTKTIVTTTRTRHPGIVWSHVTLARARQSQESSGVRSFERFVRDCMIGSSSLAYFNPGGDIKAFPDAGSGTATVYHPTTPAKVEDVMAPTTGDGWVGMYRCTWPGGYA